MGRAAGAKAIAGAVIKTRFAMVVGDGRKFDLSIGQYPHRTMARIAYARYREAVAIGGNVNVRVIGQQIGRGEQNLGVLHAVGAIAMGHRGIVHGTHTHEHIGAAERTLAVGYFIAKAGIAVVVGLGCKADRAIGVQNHTRMLRVKDAGDVQAVGVGCDVGIGVVGQ